MRAAKAVGYVGAGINFPILLVNFTFVIEFTTALIDKFQLFA